MNKYLTPEQVDFFHENGYLHLEKVFTEKECLDAIESAEKAANGHYTNYLDMHLRSPVVHEVLTGKKTCDIADDIFGGVRGIPCGTGYFFCKPNNPLEHG